MDKIMLSTIFAAIMLCYLHADIAETANATSTEATVPESEGDLESEIIASTLELEDVAGNKSHFCSLDSVEETGNITKYRYFYNETTRQCEEHQISGSSFLDDYFWTYDQCIEACQEDDPVEYGEKSLTMKCRLEAKLLSQCKLTSNLGRLARCARVPYSGSSRQTCLDAGCCWHHSYKICYQHVANPVLGESCVVVNGDSSRDRFFVLGRFQSLHLNNNGWLAYVTFNKPTIGSFRTEDFTFSRRVIIGDKFNGGKGVLVEEKRNLLAGERVSFVFSGMTRGKDW